MTPPVALTIAATDSGGGAGIAADLATFAALGVHGACVVTAITAQDTTGVHAIHHVPLEVIAAQLTAVINDLQPVVIKTGMLGTADVVELVAARCSGFRIVVDPVLRASAGESFADDEMITAYRDALIPVASAVTPNEEEFAVLGEPSGAHIVVTCGDDPALPRRVETTNDHGTGCTFSSALAAYLALGADLADATDRAHAFVAQQLTIGRDWSIGSGRGPVAHVMTPGDTP